MTAHSAGGDLFNRVTQFLGTPRAGVGGLVVLLVGGWLIVGNVNATVVAILVVALYYAACGLSFNFLFGSLGIFSLALPIFVAIGAYASIFLWNHYGVSPWWSLAISPVLAALVGLPIAFVATRIGGGAVLTALVTLIVAEAATPILIAIKPLGGAVGLYAKSPSHITWTAMQFANGADFAKILLALNVVIMAFWMWWKRSQYGLFVTATRDMPEASESVGVATARMKLTVFLIAAAIAAPAGVIYAQYNLLTSPNLFLGSSAIFQVTVIALVGGAARSWGTLVGAILITYLTQEASNLFGSNPGAAPLSFAIVFVVLALVMPRGLAGTWDRFVKRRQAAMSAGTGPAYLGSSRPSVEPKGTVGAGVDRGVDNSQEREP